MGVKPGPPQSPHFNLYCDLGQYATVALPDGTVTNPWHSADRKSSVPVGAVSLGGAVWWFAVHLHADKTGIGGAGDGHILALSLQCSHFPLIE
ncbi:unnamed protein product [Gadus morhua 'NCC']